MRTAVVMLIVSAILFGLNSVTSKLLLTSGFSPLSLVVVRFGAGFAMLVCINSMRRSLKGEWAPAHLGSLSIYGFTGFFVVPICYFLAIRALPIGVAVLIEYLAPVLVAVWGRLRWKEANAVGVWIGLVLSLVGLVSVGQVWHQFGLDWPGVCFAFVAAFALATSIVTGKVAVAERDSLVVLMWAFGIGAALSWLVRPSLSFTNGVHVSSVHGFPVWVLVIDIIVVGTVVPYILLMEGLKRLPATRVGILAILEPVAAILFSWAILGESLRPIQMIGAVAVLSGVMCAEFARASVGRTGTSKRSLMARD